MDPQEFLTGLWGNPPPGVALVWTLPDTRSRWYTRFDEVNSEMKKLSMEDVYTGVGIANRNGSRFNSFYRFTEEEVGGLSGMWADIDVAHPVHTKQNLPPTQEQALTTLKEALLEPTLLVDTGHGIQAWWLFEEPWLFESTQEHELGRRASQWWHQHINALYTAQGWTADSVFNLDRVMRMPGTWNNRDPNDRRPVTPISEKEQRYTPQTFLDHVPEDFQTSAPPPGRQGGGRKPARHRAAAAAAAPAPAGGPGQLTLSSNAEPSAVRLAALLKGNPKFRMSWENGRTDMADQSASAYDMSMATIALAAGWPDQEVVNLLICWRRDHNHDLKLRENYYVRTINKAREPMEMARAQEQLNETLLQPPDDESEVLMDNLAQLFGVDITRIVKYLGDPPIYYMYTAQGDITLGKIENIMSQEKFRALTAAATEVVIPAVSKKVWELRVQAMLFACEKVEVGDASHPARETRFWLAEYLLEKPPREHDEWEKAAEAKQPFVRRGVVHIFIDDLKKWLELAMGNQLTSHALGQRLRLCDAEPKGVNVHIGNARTTRTCWTLSQENAPSGDEDAEGRTPQEQP